jgi:hypothetical protein
VVDVAVIPAIKVAIQTNELGKASPYCLSYACLGASGASFGIFQGDTNVNHEARDTLLQALTAAGGSEDVCNRIIAAVSKPCPNGNPLSQDDTMFANAALASTEGRALVDAMDDRLLRVVLGELDTCVAAAATTRQTIESVVLLYIALWVNMTGAPGTLNKWLSGTEEVGLASPVGPMVTQQNIENYLQANTFFRLHPRNFVHMQDSVRAAVPSLPAVQV